MVPLVTVISPCLNAAGTLPDTLASVAAARAELQRWGQDLDHLILDGGSTDGTAELVATHRAAHAFCRWIEGVGGGPYGAMNAGLAAARGHYTQVLNADDLLLDPQAWARFLVEGKRQGAAVLLASIAYFRRPERRLRSQWIVPPLPDDPGRWRLQLLRGLHYPHPGFVAETALYRAEGFDERYALSADYKLMQSLLLRPGMAPRVQICTDPLVAMAEGGATGNWRAILQGRQQLAAINRELGIQAPGWRRYLAKLRQRLVPPATRIPLLQISSRKEERGH
ncbi:MAG: glycosyltransferase [Prochlorococcaceae cyanobacterium]|jgi:glycosyltransferase involved in cell wall biosynthesis